MIRCYKCVLKAIVPDSWYLFSCTTVEQPQFNTEDMLCYLCTGREFLNKDTEVTGKKSIRTMLVQFGKGLSNIRNEWHSYEEYKTQ